MSNDTNSISTPELLLRHGYSYIELIGEGSNGKTYLSKSLKTGVIVAIKALKFSDNLKNYELFKREAETLKSIHTPGTPRFYDYITGEDEFTECWLVQEYIKGNSLLDKLEPGKRVSEIKSLEIIFETAQIVHELHTKYAPPIIHRDIKPSNILAYKAESGETKFCLIDFGAVANPQKRGLNSTVAGTVGYMAPEQLIGDCTIQSDYYALGATALHIMTGINPSEFPTDGFKIQFEGMLKQRVPNVHKETIDLLHKLLAPNPEDRPKDSKELLNSISQVLVSINSTTIMKANKDREKLEKKIRFAQSGFYKFLCHGGLWLLYCLLFTGSIIFISFIFANQNLNFDPIIVIGVVVTIPIAFLIGSLGKNYESNLGKLNDKLRALPDYSLQEEKVQKYHYLVEEKADLSDSKEAAGEIVRIIDNIIEYVVAIGHEYYTAFYQDEGKNSYKLGDKIRVKYVKKFGKYLFYDIKPE